VNGPASYGASALRQALPEWASLRPPLPNSRMTGARDFVAGLARAGKGYEVVKKTVDAAFGDKTLQKTAIYAIIKKVKASKNTSDQRHLNRKKTVRNAALIASVVATVEQDRRLSVFCCRPWSWRGDHPLCPP
jgi:hypothetical protein